ncbi:MAG TPA: DinB family protein [Candidatus Binatia bacterium]|nr:DinB family protein [Candidatus Binatia bacterium]
MALDVTKEHLREELATSRRNLRDWIKTLSASDWTHPVYTHSEEWTALDVLRHLTWAEGGMARLIQQIREGQEGAPSDFDLNRYNARGVQKLKDKTAAELMAMMAQNRAWLLQILDDLNEEELQMKGRHGSLRIMSIEEVLQQIADHERQHLADLQQALNSS